MTEVVNQSQQQQAVTTKSDDYSPVELQAMEQGWLPKDQWIAQGNNPDDWRSAKEFIERGELYKAIHQTKSELKQLKAAHAALRQHHQHVFEMAYKRALDELKAQKRAAMRDENFEAVEAIEEQIEQLRAQHEREKQQLQVQVNPEVTAPHPEFVAWKARNTWYDTDPELRDFADAIGLVYYNRNPGLSPSQVLEYVERQVKTKFPDKFGVRRAAPMAALGADKTATKKGPKTTDIELDDFEREVMRQLVASGEMTEEEYKAELKKAKGLA